MPQEILFHPIKLQETIDFIPDIKAMSSSPEKSHRIGKFEFKIKTERELLCSANPFPGKKSFVYVGTIIFDDDYIPYKVIFPYSSNKLYSYSSIELFDPETKEFKGFTTPYEEQREFRNILEPMIFFTPEDFNCMKKYLRSYKWSYDENGLRILYQITNNDKITRAELSKKLKIKSDKIQRYVNNFKKRRLIGDKHPYYITVNGFQQLKTLLGFSRDSMKYGL